MKTEELIAVLAADAMPVDHSRAQRRFFAKAAGAAVLVLVAVWLLLGPRPDLDAAMRLPMFWAKLAFAASLAGAALLALHRLGYPGMRLGRAPLGIVVPFAVMGAVAGLVLLAAPAGERLPLVLGQTWRECSVSIALLSIPGLALAFWAVRELAPTRLRLAGAAAGLFAGAASALAYALHCPELQAPFLAVWYVLGMLLPAAMGALAGRRFLRW